jgi:pimeloyl-ACP methyl ester carboxylesterase
MLFVKIVAIVISLYSISFLFYGDGIIFTVHAQSDLQTIKYRNLVIDLGNGIKTNAQLTYPAIEREGGGGGGGEANGTFPGVLLIHGSGADDMNGTIGYIRIDNQTGLKIYPPARPLFQIAEYLSERGFAVLRYDKRGIGANTTILDSNVWGNATFNDLKQDAEKSLDVLIQQPEVDVNKITVLGHSEGTMIAPRVAIDNPNEVKNIVLMGAAAQNLREMFYLELVSTPLLYAQNMLDHRHDGLLSVQEASNNPVFSSMIGNLTLLLTQNITATNGSTTTAQQQRLHPEYNTDNDTFISINDELKPKLVENFESVSVVTPGKCMELGGCPIWLRSHYALEPTLNIIGKVPSNTSILILNGENDTQTPVQGAFLLQQKLTEINHPDHIIITYPNLGHLFYPSSQWQTGIGPIQPYVLADLYSWLEAHSGFTQSPSPFSSSFSNSSSTGQG